MNETTTNKKTEFVFRRLADSFDQFLGDLGVGFLLNPVSLVLLGAVLLAVTARVVYRFAHPSGGKIGTRDATSLGVVWGAACWLVPYFGLFLTWGASRIVSRMNSDWSLFEKGAGAVVAGLAGLVALACYLFPLAALVLGVLRTVRYLRSRARPSGEAAALALAWSVGLTFATFVVWCATVYYFIDTDPNRPTDQGVSAVALQNALKWYSFVTGLFLLGCVFVTVMYVKDTKSVSWSDAVHLALLRITVYALLCVVFLLPAELTSEDTHKQSRVVVLLDISPSMHKPDELGAKPRTRMQILIEFLTDENVAFLKRLLEKNPVAVYAFGTRLDETPTVLAPGEAAWSRAEWEAFARYDFRPFLLRGLSAEGREQLQKSGDWAATNAGTDSWAASLAARRDDPELQKNFGLAAAEDADKFKKNLTLLDRRIDVARTILLGTNVADSVKAAVDRESANMVQGIVVFSDGRSNLGSESGYVELRERATRENIPVFTVAVGEDRQTSAITISDVQAPGEAPIDEAWKVIVEADGVNMANKEVDVFLDLFMPETQADGSTKPKDMKRAPPDVTLTEKLVFAPGDPPHGQAEFVIDPAKLPEKLTVESKDAAIKKRVLLAGDWGARARIAKDPQEAFAEAEHVRERPNIKVVQQKLRVLLIAGAPSREFAFLRTLLVREAQDKRATLTTFVQNEAGTTGKLTPETDETILLRFPNRFDLSNKKLEGEEKGYNLNDYDVILAFDPDWSELNAQQADDLGRWVREGGGGLIYVAGPINTFQLARVEENNGPLLPLLNVLPVIPDDIIAARIKSTPKTPRRLYLHPERILGSDLLKLDDKVPDDPKAGWERFFTDRDKYERLTDTDAEGNLKELLPRRGFFSAYPVKAVKPGSAVLAEFADAGDNREPLVVPWIVTNNPSAAYRTAFLASGELYKMRVYEPSAGTGREYFERFYVKLIKYMAAKRNVKAPRGRVLVGKEGVSGAPLRVQARILNESARPYKPGEIAPKFRIVQETPGGEKREPGGPWELAPRQGAGGEFDGYYAGQVLLDPKLFPPGDFVYRVVIDVPDSAGDTLTDTFGVRRSDPEMDNTKPDLPAMLRMASEFNTDLQARIPDLRVKAELGSKLPKEAGVPRLAFRIADKELLRLIPDCMTVQRVSQQNRGPVRDLWDKPLKFTVTQKRAEWALGLMFVIPLLFGMLRGLWELLPEIGRIVVAVLGFLFTLNAFAGAGVLVLLGLVDWWPVAVALGLFVFGPLTFRLPWWAGLVALGAVALGGLGTLVATHLFDLQLAFDVRLVDIDLSADRQRDGLHLLLWLSVGLALARGAWAGVAESLKSSHWWAVVSSWTAVGTLGLAVWGAFAVLDRCDWWHWGITSGLFVLSLLLFRGPWSVGVGVFATAAATGAALLVLGGSYDYPAVPEFQISFVMLAVVSLLCCEWTARKLLRLA